MSDLDDALRALIAEEDVNQDAPAPRFTPDEAATRRIVLTRSSGVCEICGRFTVAEAAHRVGRGVRGLWTPANILGACRACHRRDHAHPQAAYWFGWHLPGGTDPLEAPVLLVVAGEPVWVLLDDQGGREPLAGQEIMRLRASGAIPTLDDEADWAQVRYAMTSGR